MTNDSPNSWDARAAAHSFYGFTDLPTVAERGTIVVTPATATATTNAHTDGHSTRPPSRVRTATNSSNGTSTMHMSPTASEGRPPPLP